MAGIAHLTPLSLAFRHVGGGGGGGMVKGWGMCRNAVLGYAFLIWGKGLLVSGGWFIAGEGFEVLAYFRGS